MEERMCHRMKQKHRSTNKRTSQRSRNPSNDELPQEFLHPAIRGAGSRFVDLGSGVGRLVLAIAAMEATWTSVIGVEASEALHNLAKGL